MTAKGKRAAALLLVFALLSVSLTGCAGGTGVYAVHVEGSVFTGKTGGSVAAGIRFDPAWITEGDNTEYSPELAAFAALLSADTYFREKDIERGNPNRVLFDDASAEDYSPTVLASRLGFSDVKYVESYKEKEYSCDGSDSATLTMAYRSVKGKYDLYVVALRGCFSAGEWNSIFDLGCDSAAYEAYTGEHPEWTDRSCFKGVGIAKNRALEIIREFIAEHDDAGRENCILVTGHSRGGVLANLIGAELEKDESVRSFTYTFNAMAATADASAPAYKTVFNVFDSADFFADPVPLGNESFYRYGTDMTLRIEDDAQVLAAIEALQGDSGFHCLSADAAARYREMFGARFADRASLYEPRTMTWLFGTEGEAAECLARCETLIGADEGLDLGTFCSMREAAKTEDGGYAVTMDYCDGGILAAYCKILAYGSAAHDAAVSLFAEDAAACEIADFLADNGAALVGGHLLANSYVLAEFVK